jgi:glycosyltransferase involved in cell wall biosynthesis
MNLLEVVECCSAGTGRHVRTLCEGLATEGHRVTVVYAPSHADRAFLQFVDAWSDDIRFVALDLRREVSPVSDLRALAQLLRLIRRGGPFDVVHGHSSKGGALARIAGRTLGVPTVYTPHGLVLASPKLSRTEYFVYTWIERLLGYVATSKFITVSKDESEFASKLRLIPKGRVAHIEHGLNHQDFEYLSREIIDNDFSQKPLTFGSVLRFCPEKAPGQLVEAFIHLVGALPQIPMRLVMAGDGELLEDVKRQVDKSGLKEKISLPGWTTNPKELLREFDIFVLSSLSEAASPYSALEAMAAGRPIVSTNVFGVSRMLPRIPGNVMVSVGEPDALTEGMKQMITHTDANSLRQSLREIGQGNRDYVQKHFLQSETTRRTINLYRSLI